MHVLHLIHKPTNPFTQLVPIIHFFPKQKAKIIKSLIQQLQSKVYFHQKSRTIKVKMKEKSWI